MCATLTLNLSRSAGKALFHEGSFGWFSQVRPHAQAPLTGSNAADSNASSQ